MSPHRPRRLHRELGFARFDRYAEERVDVAARTVRRWMRLARLDGEPRGAVATALRTGEITEMQAELVAQASTPTSAPEPPVAPHRAARDPRRYAHKTHPVVPGVGHAG